MRQSQPRAKLGLPLAVRSRCGAVTFFGLLLAGAISQGSRYVF